jgi:Raf kinase inhibitor-like YbhB/YbcL family protein
MPARVSPRCLTLGLAFVAVMALSLACDDGGSVETPEVRTILQEEERMMELRSPAFEADGEIPTVYTCDGQDVSPPLEISGVPQGTQALALVVDDPDAPVGTWDHWLLYNIAPDTTGIEEDVRNLGTPGTNSWGNQEYGGPCPPGGRHRYFFRVYALNQRLDLQAGAGKTELFKAMEGHILDEAEVMGTYARRH